MRRLRRNLRFVCLGDELFIGTPSDGHIKLGHKRFYEIGEGEISG